MSSQASRQDTLHYRLRPNSQGIRLDIWEDSPKCSPDQASYRFFVTYQLKSTEDAQVILDRYLITNNVYTAIDRKSVV